MFLDKFKNEVDFHHKIAFRFERVYRLGKDLDVGQRNTLNLGLIQLIGNFSDYIEKDNMSLFYILFFCIFYRNQEMILFIRQLIAKMKSNHKIDRLLELIDIHGLDRIRTVGEMINNIVYHMVFYEAINDKLKVVYTMIFRQMRFVQLRDTDAVYLLETRDYDIIRRSFDKYVIKINNEALGYECAKQEKCHRYRKYNQAYFEEILINNKIE